MGLDGRRALFISYNGMLDALGQTQVIPYLRELAKRGVRFTLLSFEKPEAFTPEGKKRAEELKNKLLNHSIEWHTLRYHRSPSLPATMYDVMVGIRYASSLVRRHKIELIHARGHIPATIGVALKRRFQIKLIFDLRGLMAEEYVDANHWSRRGLRYRITKTAERRILEATDGLVTLTERIWPIVKEWDGLRGRNVSHAVIPCCVDLSLFYFSETDRAKRRTELGLGDCITFVYSGSLDGWYLTEQMADFFAYVARRQPAAHLLWLTNGRHERVRELMSARGIGEDQFTIRSVAASEVPSYLAAGDMGLSFIKPCFSKIASSPTKNGEYLACGLPIIINAGIGDSDSLVTDWQAGVLIKDLDQPSFDRAYSELKAFTNNNGVRAKTRQVAERLFNLETIAGERYADLYEKVLNG
jgi:glycosyltransferase involved in cell wall biosynthesis